MDSPASLAACVLDRLEDDLPSVRAWLADLAAADLPPAVAAQVAALEGGLDNVVLVAEALATACGELAA